MGGVKMGKWALTSRCRLQDNEVGRLLLKEFMKQEARALANNTIVSLGFSVVASKSIQLT